MNSDNAALREALWKMYLEHCTQVRHHETQRSTVAGTFIAITAALLGFVAFDKALSASDLPITLFVMVLGIFGAVFSAKQWERASFHTERARKYRDKADELLGGNTIRFLRQEADSIHNVGFPKLKDQKLHLLWIGLYMLIAFFGIVLSLIATFSPVTTI